MLDRYVVWVGSTGYGFTDKAEAESFCRDKGDMFSYVKENSEQKILLNEFCVSHGAKVFHGYARMEIKNDRLFAFFPSGIEPEVGTCRSDYGLLYDEGSWFSFKEADMPTDELKKAYRKAMKEGL